MIQDTEEGALIIIKRGCPSYGSTVIIGAGFGSGTVLVNYRDFHEKKPSDSICLVELRLSCRGLRKGNKCFGTKRREIASFP